MVEVVVERNYTDGIITRFQDAFPEQIPDKSFSSQWTTFITQLNQMFSEAETFSYVCVLEGLLSALTLYSLPLFYETKAKKKFKEIREFLDTSNKTIFSPKGMELCDPFANGLLFLKIIVHNGAR
eukprot:TRINITY_DN1155_c0_g1_i10.p1 TRINITY_DN1155_c0_g1~~TRINITY_DN1155_c0_g1_i10.p1  ORF type:complete len:125 (+),score=16.60 TRINITY_DN1155_c0_g1_i10:94-468(+)